ncbi:molybdate-transporting ATPase [Propionibacterium ruminifibrarum]|uniref:Molybdate-transporting ATPase n=1 Tax=Propionibacterium ruminifibrarum TaxID=1962131 RepID=A0A375I6D3_9ACTN|nr:molybdate-transporting ATPase [Propionibacterium ruminifibrarum]
MKLVRSIGSAAVAVALSATVVGCSSGDASSDSSQDETTVLTVYAAASLTASYDEMATAFETEHPGVDVQFNYAGSQTLVDQITQGAPADVLATANTSTMSKAVDAGAVGETTEFATNVLTLITPAGNPAGVTGLDDSLDAAQLVICAPEVPCGSATQQLTELLGVTLNPVSEEQQVTDVVGKVTSGEATAGIVYRTDAMEAGDQVTEVPIEGADQVVNHYPIATVNESEHAELAQQFVDYVLSDAGQATLSKYGFSPTA